MAKKVLVVDDEPHIGALIELTLGRRGYEVVVAFDAEEALAAIGQDRFDLFLLDIIMPQSKMNGLDLCRHLRQDPHTAGAPVLVLTAMGQDQFKAVAQREGATDFVTKPFSPRDLVRRVEDLIGAP